MLMDAGLDTGPMLALARTPILETDDSQILHDRLAGLGADLLVQTLPGLVAGTTLPQPQPATGATYAAKIKKEHGQVEWALPARQIFNRIRAFTPWPGAFTYLPGETKPSLLKLAKVTLAPGQGQPGEILAADKNGLVVACGEGAIQIGELQREGGKRLAVAQFLAGFPLTPGTVLLSRV